MPKISIALFGRNDHYGKNYLGKIAFSLRSLQRALKKVDYEIVLLDYNPPKDRPLLSECFPNSKYPRIKHVVFSHEDHLEFIKCHLEAGAELRCYKKVKPPKVIRNINFISTFAADMSIKNSSGDYILTTGSDNIFPKQFGDFVERLKPNIAYRTWIYKTISDDLNKAKLISFDQYDKIKNEHDILKINADVNAISFKVKFRINVSPGNFILMDKDSWKDVGGIIPTINPRLPYGDTQILFHAISLGKKIKCADFPIFNMNGALSNFYQKMSSSSNYKVELKGMKYNHQREVGDIRQNLCCKEWRKFYKWIRKYDLEPNREYFRKINYKSRLKEIKNLFKSILPSKFLLY
jgi:hypothetical protein